ncbi:MAG: Flp family type IVb pilin [Armatimonadetes bacterium]|nr:Flp family type IVb pilin [Armatimonadota bacterium]
MWSSIVKVAKDEEGATLVEYGLMLMLIMVVCVGAVTAIGLTVNSKFESCASQWP